MWLAMSPPLHARLVDILIMIIKFMHLMTKFIEILYILGAHTKLLGTPFFSDP